MATIAGGEGGFILFNICCFFSFHFSLCLEMNCILLISLLDFCFCIRFSYSIREGRNHNIERFGRFKKRKYS